MATIHELLRQYIAAVSDPTRGAIVMELGHAKELTPTQIARRLGLTANNVYHHMRVLRAMGIVDPPRAVPRDTYVEKYYRINADVAAAVNSDPDWPDMAQLNLTTADRKALFTGLCMTMAQLLMRAARRYEAMDDDAFDRLVFQRRLGLVSINDLQRDTLERRLTNWRALVAEEQAAASGVGAQPTRDMALMAALPLMWDVEDGEESAESAEGEE